MQWVESGSQKPMSKGTTLVIYDSKEEPPFETEVAPTSLDIEISTSPCSCP